MLIDFCHYSVHPRIKTDKVSFDGYEIQNLISSNPEEKKKGFLSDHFIKPPVNVTVQFPCNVSVYRIVIDPVIGQQKSCDFKIFTACEKMIDSWLYKNSDDGIVKSDGVIFSYVGSVSMAEPTQICFVNNQFKERNLWRIENVPDLNRYPCVAQLNSRKQGGLCNASHVTVCVNRSKNGKSVALRRLEIWGIPSLKVPHPVQMTLKNVYLEAIKPREVIQNKIPNSLNSSALPNAKTTDGDSPTDNSKVLIDGVPVPDDFLDQITFEIMTVPVLLPCGKVVDRSTLERFVNSEASWGRQPSDPFTGVVFSQGAGPVTNTSLKARIDQFVLKHSESLRIPKTLGHKDAYNARKNIAVPSKLVHRPSTVVISENKYPIPGNENLLSRMAADYTDLTTSQIKSVVKGDRSQTYLSKSNESVIKDDICLTISGRNKRKQTGEVKPQSELSFKKVKEGKGHSYIDLTENEEDTVGMNKKQLKVTDHSSVLSQSLDDALLSTLGNFPSFMKKSSKLSSDNSNDKETMCSKCKTEVKGSDVVKYKMPCGHLICRPCLVQENTSFICSICSSQCKSSQAVRVF